MEGFLLISEVTNILIAVSALGTAFFAYKGLHIWKQQHKGKVEYDLARRLLVSVIRYKDAIDNARFPTIKFAPISAREASDLNEEQRAYAGLKDAYVSRYDFVANARSDLYVNILEAQVLWGEEIKSIVGQMLHFEKELKTAVEYHLNVRDPDATDAQKQKAIIFLKNMDHFLFASFEDDDEFDKTMNDLVKRAEDYLKPKLKQ